MDAEARKFWDEFAKRNKNEVGADEQLESLLNLAKEVVEKADKNAAEDPATEEVLVVVVEPKKRPYKKIIKNDLESFKKIVGGWIEHISIGERPNGSRLGIYLNEEGKLIGLEPNRVIIGKRGGDMFVGTFFVTAHNLQGDTVSLTDQEAAQYIKMFAPLYVYL
jgi:hypothetical protein